MTQTVLLTGASGYIAKHVALKLLDAGYRVRGTVRDLARGEEVSNAVRPHLRNADDLENRLTFVALDLNSDDGWDAAMQGIDVLMHTASPFPLTPPKDEEDLIRPAVDGALRALKAAHRAGVRQAVLTSSSVAIMSGTQPPDRAAFDETDWLDVTSPGATASAYAKSKTLAEQAAWDYVRGEGAGLDLTVINPVMVFGPPLDHNYGSSVSIVERLLTAKDPMLPKIGMPIVDVRDVAEMHLRAITTLKAAGQRFIAADSSMWFHEMAATLKAHLPGRRIVTMQAPNFAVRILALFDPAIAGILPNLGQQPQVSNAKARDILGMRFIDASKSMTETADYLIAEGLVT